MSNLKSTISTNWFDFSPILGGCHVVYHFPNNTSNDSHFMHYDLHCVTYFFLDFYQAGKALQPTLMAMAGPHHLDMTNKNHHIYLFIPYSHHDPLSRIKHPYSQISRVFQNNHHEFYDRITEWLEQSYLVSRATSNKFQSFLALAKKLGTTQHTLARGP